MIDEAPRLYAARRRIAADVIAPQHRQIHSDLDAWAQWCRGGRVSAVGTCESIEGRYDAGEGGRKVRAPVISLPENPRHRLIDYVVRYMRMQLQQHGECVVMFYVDRTIPPVICRKLVLHWSIFPTFMFDCRAAVINLMRRYG